VDGKRVVMIKPWGSVLYQRSHLKIYTLPDDIRVVYARRSMFCSRADDARPNTVNSTRMSDREKRKNAPQRRRYRSPGGCIQSWRPVVSRHLWNFWTTSGVICFFIPFVAATNACCGTL